MNALAETSLSQIRTMTYQLESDSTFFAFANFNLEEDARTTWHYSVGDHKAMLLYPQPRTFLFVGHDVSGRYDVMIRSDVTLDQGLWNTLDLHLNFGGRQI